jgi:hypothetical protein
MLISLCLIALEFTWSNAMQVDLVKTLVDMGFDVFWSDVDVVWFRSPFE